MDTVTLLNGVVGAHPGAVADAKAAAKATVENLEAELNARKRGGELRSQAPDLHAALQHLKDASAHLQQDGKQALEKVSAVTGSIQSLDLAKENVSSSIRLLRQLRMLSKLRHQLDFMLKESRFEEMRPVVRAAGDLMEYFRPLRALPQIATLSKEVGSMEEKIYNAVEDELKAAIGPLGPVAGADRVKAACEVLPNTQSKLIQFYCDCALEEYRQVFSTNDEAGSLENVERRFAYLRNKVFLRFMASHANLFPPSWPVKKMLYERAAEITAADLSAQLPKLRSDSSGDIATLLSTLRDAREFETSAKMGTPISGELLPFMDLWVRFQNTQLGARIGSWSNARPDLPNGAEVVPSSRELISLYKALVAQLEQVGPPQPKLVVQFAEVLAMHLGGYARAVLASYVPENGVIDVMHVRTANATGEYLTSAGAQLERTLCGFLPGSIDAQNEISQIFETNAFAALRQVGVRCERSFVSHSERVLDHVWAELAQHYTHLSRNGALDVTRVSAGANDVVKSVYELLTDLTGDRPPAPMPSQMVLMAVYTKVAELVSRGFLTTAMARVTKPISDGVVEQMLLDLGAVKNDALMRALTENTKVDSSRRERLQARLLDVIGMAEAVLKVLHTPAEPMDVFVQNYLLLVKDRSTLNFRKMLDVKGVRFQSRAMEKFKLMASQEPSLQSENPLLRAIPTVAPATDVQSFNLKRIGDFLRREHPRLT